MISLDDNPALKAASEYQAEAALDEAIAKHGGNLFLKPKAMRNLELMAYIALKAEGPGWRAEN